MDLDKQSQSKKQPEGEQEGRPKRAAVMKKSVPQPAKPKKAESGKKPVKKSDEPRIAWWHRLRQYLREVVYELRKVNWPSRKETIGSTVVVLVIVILSGVYLGFVDLILSRLIRMLIG